MGTSVRYKQAMARFLKQQELIERISKDSYHNVIDKQNRVCENKCFNLRDLNKHLFK